MKSDLQCSGERKAPDAVQVTCENTGRAYAQVREFTVSSASGQKLASRENAAYILPGIKRSVDIRRGDGPIPGGKLKLDVALDDGSTRAFELNVPD
jgi:fimbrial chaperone protein